MNVERYKLLFTFLFVFEKFCLRISISFVNKQIIQIRESERKSTAVQVRTTSRNQKKVFRML